MITIIVIRKRCVWLEKYKIEKINWEKKYLDCIWYDGLVAKIQSDKGKYCIFANGEIKAKLLSKNSNNGFVEVASIKGNGINFYQEMAKYIKDDEELGKIIEDKHNLYKLEIYDNNWLELDLLNNNGEYEELDIVLDNSSLKDAVKEVIKMIPDIEKELEEQEMIYGEI